MVHIAFSHPLIEDSILKFLLMHTGIAAITHPVCDRGKKRNAESVENMLTSSYIAIGGGASGRVHEKRERLEFEVFVTSKRAKNNFSIGYWIVRTMALIGCPEDA
ncbi:hypothetical protein TNCT_671311 [Trichonephila clavata]|uniref:Uncharacterized protein n=1 Tax=Trichonephila clavata TaxID=2740835 RepID=A0A8X6F729_TRICU|nr:hypothetical protein TNCT_671311 [Trichonephila clavata]